MFSRRDQFRFVYYVHNPTFRNNNNYFLPRDDHRDNEYMTRGRAYYIVVALRFVLFQSNSS